MFTLIQQFILIHRIIIYFSVEEKGLFPKIYEEFQPKLFIFFFIKIRIFNTYIKYTIIYLHSHLFNHVDLKKLLCLILHFYPYYLHFLFLFSNLTNLNFFYLGHYFQILWSIYKDKSEQLLSNLYYKEKFSNRYLRQHKFSLVQFFG